MAEFKHAYTRTAKWEGGYANVTCDRGGETYAGISRKYHPTWNGWAIIDNYKPLRHNQKIKNTDIENAVRIFYYREFWQPIQGDLIENQDIADFVYDWHVNSGKSGIIAVQRALKLKPDGVAGKNTLSKLQTADLNTLIDARVQFFQSIADKDPKQAKFLTGWLNRAKSFTK